MPRFKIPPKRFKLDFLGEEWKECYLDFTPLTFGELEKFAQINVEDETDITKSAGIVFSTIEKAYIGGKALGENGKIIDVKKEDLKDLPLEVIVKAVNFLSGNQTES